MSIEAGTLIHATAVCFGGQAALIRGASGSGKSALGLQLMAMGCQLVGDDQCITYAKEGTAWVDAAPGLPQLIEARGVGLLTAQRSGPAKIRLVVDMDECSEDRMPTAKHTQIAGLPIAVINKARGPHFPSAILLYLKGATLT